MSHNKQEIAEKVRNGSYFKDAIAWYNDKYLHPVTERSVMLIFMIAALCGLLPIASFLSRISESRIIIPFPIYSADLTEHYSVITPLVKAGESSQTAIAKYLIKDYVKSREEYIYKNVNTESSRNLLKKVKFSSSKQVLNEYVGYMSETNPYSPVTRYKSHTNRLIEIKSLSFLDSDQTSGKAKVVFEANEVANDGATQKSTWEVILNFRLPDIVTIARTGSPMRFVVGYYRVKPLEVGAVELHNSTEAVPVGAQTPVQSTATDAANRMQPDPAQKIPENNGASTDNQAKKGQ